MGYSISKVAVLGAGVMGAGIAAHFAGSGIPVCMLDILPKGLSAEEEAKGLSLEDTRIRNKFALTGKDRVLNPANKAIYEVGMGDLIETGNFTDDMGKIAECDLIIEVVLENLSIKKELMNEIARLRKLGSIVATNTSGVSVNKIVEDLPLEFKQHFAGMHFFNPPRYMKLLEVIPGEHTLPELTRFLVEFATMRLGKGVVLAKDTPNFIANRIGVQASVAVMRLTKEYGYDIAKADTITGKPMGRPTTATFRTADMVGLDIILHTADNVLNNIDDPYEKEANEIPEYVKSMIDKGLLGDKTNGGFYKKETTPEGTKRYVWDYIRSDYVELTRGKEECVEIAKKAGDIRAQIHALVWGDKEENVFAWKVIKSTILYSAKIMPLIADRYSDIDQAIKWGFNWEMGPFELWDAIGLKKSIERMQLEGEEIPEWVQDRIAKGQEQFYTGDDLETPYIQLSNTNRYRVIESNNDALLKDIGNQVVCLEFASKGNTVTDGVLDMIFKSIETVENGDYVGLVIANQAKNFSAGANLMQIAQFIQEENWDRIKDAAKRLQYANLALKYAKKPVVTCAHGMTLGGGAEIAMHGYKQVPHAETYMGLVEMGVGLVPAGGGIKELLCRYCEGAENMSSAELINRVKKAWEVIATAKVSGSAFEAVNLQFMKCSDPVVMNLDYLVDKAKGEVISLSENGFRANVKRSVKVTGTTGRAAIRNVIEYMKEGRFISEYDAYLADKVAFIITGGDVLAGALLSEEDILGLEREAFISLCGEPKTQERIKHMLAAGKPLRN